MSIFDVLRFPISFFISQKKKILNYLFEKFSNAGIEVVTNKNEFDLILQRREILQKLSEEFKKEKTLYESNAENNNQPGNTIKRFYKDNYNGKKNQLCLNNLNKLNDEINISWEILKEKPVEIQRNEKKETGNLSASNIDPLTRSQSLNLKFIFDSSNSQDFINNFSWLR